MNLFMPYKSVIKSVRALDDRRLVKQILECKVMLDIALGKKSGYSKHPVCVHYKDYPDFIHGYGMWACIEYAHRFDKLHKYAAEFSRCIAEIYMGTPLLYAAGSKGSKDCIRTTENVTELFQQKLIEKWNNDKVPPKWTNRGMPEFYKEKQNVEQTK